MYKMLFPLQNIHVKSKFSSEVDIIIRN